MNRTLPLMLAALAAGCQPGEMLDEPATQPELEALRAHVATLNEKSFLLHKDLSKTVMDLQQRVASLESTIKAYEVEIRRLNEKLGRTPVPDAAAGGPQNPPVKPDPVPDTLQSQMKEIDTQMARLREGAPPEEVAAALAPVAAHAASKLAEALKDAILDIDRLRRLEQVLARLPAGDLRVPLAEALKDRARRSAAARVVGETKHRELSAILEAHTADADFEFCYLVGASLVRCKNPAGVPALLRALRSPDRNTRFLAISELRPLSGQSFGYDYAKGEEANAKAVAAWEEWFEKSRGSLFK